MAHKVTIFAVNRHEIARPGELQHGFQLFLTRVPRDVYLGDLFVMHLGAAPVEMIDQIGDRLLVAGDEFGGKDYRISRFDLDCLVIIQSHAVEHRQRLPLAPRSEESKLIGWQIMPAFAFGHEVSRQAQVS